MEAINQVKMKRLIKKSSLDDVVNVSLANLMERTLTLTPAKLDIPDDELLKSASQPASPLSPMKIPELQPKSVSSSVNLTIPWDESILIRNTQQITAVSDEWDCLNNSIQNVGILRSPGKDVQSVCANDNYPASSQSCTGLSEWKKWHILKLRKKMNFLQLNDRGTRKQLIERLEDYYKNLPNKISHSKNPWICQDTDLEIFNDMEILISIPWI